MNLGINPAVTNYNCQRKNSPNFGMAVLVDKKAIPVIKEQAMKLSKDVKRNLLTEFTPYSSPDPLPAYDKFWKDFNDTISRQESNPVNIIVKKARGRKALSAVVVDSTAETAVKNKKFSQGLFSENGSLKFLSKAEKQANKLNDTNSKVNELKIATKNDYKPGKKNAEETIIQIQCNQ